MFMGMTMEKLILIGVLAALVIGPERLPGVARRFTEFVKAAAQWGRRMAVQVREETGADDIDWRALDPRQYDPRRIIREALLEETPAVRPSPETAENSRPESEAVQVAASVPERVREG